MVSQKLDNVFIYKNEIVFLDGGLFVQIKKKNNEIFISIFSQKGETYIQRHKKILKNLLFKKEDYYFIFRTGLIFYLSFGYFLGNLRLSHCTEVLSHQIRIPLSFLV